MSATNDPIDIAYLSMGAVQALDEGVGEKGDAVEMMGYSQVEFITAMLAVCGPALIKHQSECTDYEACYAYDISEPLGMWFVRETVRMGKIPTTEMALATARKYAE